MSAPSPGARRRQQRLARWVRRAPGYDLLVMEVLPRVRRNAVLSDLAWRVFAPEHGAGHLDVPLHGGRHLTGRDVRLLPVVGVVAVGLDAPAVVALLDRLAGLQRQHRSFRPLLIVDQPVFAEARAHGYVVEHVVPAAFWDPVAGSWEDYLAARLASVTDHYQLWGVLHAQGDALSDRDQALLAALASRLPGGLDVQLVGDEDGRTGRRSG